MHLNVAMAALHYPPLVMRSLGANCTHVDWKSYIRQEAVTEVLKLLIGKSIGDKMSLYRGKAFVDLGL